MRDVIQAKLEGMHNVLKVCLGHLLCHQYDNIIKGNRLQQLLLHGENGAVLLIGSVVTLTE